MKAVLKRDKMPERVGVATLLAKIRSRQATVGVVGMGYVGQPLAIAAHDRGFQVIGFDTDPAKVSALNEGRSSIRTTPDPKVREMRASGRFRATGIEGDLAKPDVIM